MFFERLESAIKNAGIHFGDKISFEYTGFGFSKETVIGTLKTTVHDSTHEGVILNDHDFYSAWEINCSTIKSPS